jgi:hypothetical protein
MKFPGAFAPCEAYDSLPTQREQREQREQLIA